MKIHRVLVCILIVAFALNFVSCFFRGSNAREPYLKELHFENDVVTGVYDVVSNKQEYVWYTLNNSKLCVLDLYSDLSLEIEFDSEIIDVASYDGNTVFVALASNEVLFYDISNNDFELLISNTFENTIKEIDYRAGSSKEYLHFVLLENGEFYSFGRNYDNIISNESSEDEIYSNPQLLFTEIKMITYEFCVKNDNSIVVYKDNEVIENSIGDVESIIMFRGSEHLIIDNSLYYLSWNNNEIVFDRDLENSLYVFGHNSMLYVDGLNRVYYTGICYGEYYSKGVPEANDYYVEYLPANYNYLPTSREIVCYDEHTILCYAVVKY